MLVYKVGLSGLVLAMSISMSNAGAVERGEFKDGYEANGIIFQPTGKFAEPSMSHDGVTPQSDIWTPQAASVPSSLLIESTLSRQLYHSAPTCAILNATNIWNSPAIIFNDTITPQNLTTASGPNVVEVNFTSQLGIKPANPVSGVPADGIMIKCTIYQGSGSTPCSNASNSPVMLRQRQNESEKYNLVMTSYLGYAQIDPTQDIRVEIGLFTNSGTPGTVCFNNLILRTR